MHRESLHKMAYTTSSVEKELFLYRKRLPSQGNLRFASEKVRLLPFSFCNRWIHQRLLAPLRTLPYPVPVNDVTNQNFGLLIAFVLPGFILLWGLQPHSHMITGWLGHAATDVPSVGGFLYITMASVGAGQLVSTLRWLLIDTLHHRTGVRPPRWDFRKLKDRVTAYDRLIEIHYRYYQFHANSLLAVSISALLRWLEQGFRVRELFLLLAIDTLLYLGSRDTLSKYYRRVEELLARDF